MPSPLVQAWRMSNEANLFLLSKLPVGSLGDRYSTRTRDVASQFAHMHSVRLRWLRHAAPELVGDVAVLPKEPRPNKAVLKKALKASERLVAAFLAHCEALAARLSGRQPFIA